MIEGGKPLPSPTPLTQPFWDACREHRLLVQRCTACGARVFIPQECCRACLSDALEWVPASGKGWVYSYTVVWRPQTPAFEVPYVVAVIALEDGYRMLSNLVGCPEGAVTVGMEVEVAFVDVTEAITLPMFRPRGPQA